MGHNITHSHDQAVALSHDVMLHADAEVDERIEQSLLNGSPQIALDYGYNLIQTGQMRGIQLARLLYTLEGIWDSFETDDTIEDAVFKGMGVSARKFDDYTRLYRYVLKDHPELSGKPIGGLMAIITAARDGDFGKEDWAELDKAHDKAAMVEIRRRARGIYTRGHSRVTIGWDRDGFVWAYKEGEEQESLGHIKRRAATEHGKIAVDRLMDKRVIRR